MRVKPVDFDKVPEERYKLGWFKDGITEFEPKDEFERERRYLLDHYEIMSTYGVLKKECYTGHYCGSGTMARGENKKKFERR